MASPFDFDLVDDLPVWEPDVGDVIGFEVIFHGIVVGCFAGREVWQVGGDGFGGVHVEFIGADDAAEAAFNPAGGVGAVEANDASVFVGDDGTIFVEGHAGYGGATVADGARDEACGSLCLAGGARFERRALDRALVASVIPVTPES